MKIVKTQTTQQPGKVNKAALQQSIKEKQQLHGKIIYKNESEHTRKHNG